MSFPVTDGVVDDPTNGHPFPQLRRPAWVDLRGAWGFAYDDDDRGVNERWFERPAAQRRIVVPFPPESSASTIADTGYHSVVWYSRSLDSLQLLKSGVGEQGDRLLLHFGAVDYHARVWLNGFLLGAHEGGHTPFVFDITGHVTDGENLLVVRAEDNPTEVGKPRGKQEWLPEARDIWYDRTTGIWQTVWLEAAPADRIDELAWLSTRNSDAVRLEVGLSTVPPAGSQLEVTLSFDDEVLAHQVADLDESSSPVLTVELRRQLNGQHYDKLLWSPEHPRLIEAKVRLRTPGDVDEVASYFGLRTVDVRAGHFVLNDRPYYVRSVLEQGYWPESHLAAPSDQAIREEVELIKSFGFNAARLHQKFEDPRFLYWADRLGLLLWGEAPAAYEFSVNATTRLLAEWTAILRRDRSHPSIVTWVPVNESWGVQHISVEPAQRAFTRAMADLTRALDPTRPVISNDGWEHTNSDILSVHDYDDDPRRLKARYASRAAVDELLAGYGPADRLMMAEGSVDPARPVMVTEFGGIRFITAPDASSWGYSTAADAREFETRLRRLFDALHASPILAGFCYTQLTDTMQEANGLTDGQRQPKLPVATIRSIVTGVGSGVLPVPTMDLTSPQG